MSNQNNTCICKPFFGCVCNQEVPAKVIQIVEAFGGIHNINAFSNSVSELRYDLKDVSLVQSETLKTLGASKVTIFQDTKHVQAQFGDVVEELNFEVRKYAQKLASQTTNHNNSVSANNEAKNTQKQALNTLNVLSPVDGQIIALSELKDGIFSEGLVGQGVAIKLSQTSGKIVLKAPFDGSITNLPASKNQFLFATKCGIEVIIILGQDSYKLNGIGINLLAPVNTELKAGQDLFELNLDQFSKEQIDTHIIICATHSSSLQTVVNKAQQQVKVGQNLFDLV